MGCYMSTPDDKVYITDGKGKNFLYATASCQGWRREQEDAEDCIPYFDDNASLFILCDGHGGAEVAQYTVKHFPQFLKNHPLYKEGKYEQALEKAFIDFDALLRTEEALNELSKIAYDGRQQNDEQHDENSQSVLHKDDDTDGTANTHTNSSNNEQPGSSAGPSSSNGPSSIAEDVDSETLKREAQVPLNELIDKYSGQPPVKGRANSIRQASLNLGGSPVIRSSQKDDGDDSDTGAKGKTDQDGGADASISKSEQPTSSKQSDEGPSSSSQLPGVSDLKEILKKAMDVYFDENDDNSEDDSEFNGEEESENDDEEEDDDDEDSDEDEDEDGDDECDEDATGEKSRNKRLRHKRYKQPASGLIDGSSSDDDSDDDQDVDEDEEEESSDECDDEEDGEEDYALGPRFAYLKKLNRNLKDASRIHKPGIDSGCTVVVALVKEKKLYVASAGDSRCIVIMRDGQCKPMSFDHKPEDTLERTRILKAGGRVIEGRVNGGLNLSRAFGDFTYKDASLDAEDQMITPCPDVRVTDLDPDQVEYIFLACDGIWNSMKNQQVTKFIRKVAPTVNHDLAEVSLSLFSNCIAPGTDGDGTGCDNMTCIIVRYNSSLKMEEKNTTTNQIDLRGEVSTDGQQEPNQVQTTTSQNDDSLDKQKAVVHATNKRSAQDDDTEEGSDRSACKRRCIRLPPNNNSQY